MRTERRKAFLAGFVAAGVLAALPGCKDSSNMVTAPTTTVAPAASVSGTWTGMYRSDTMSCASAPVTFTLQQTGTNVTGNVATSSCGPNGSFKGTVQGNQLVGAVDMLGCTGGAVNGQISPSGMSITVGDLYRPLVTGTQVVAAGGGAALNR